jgi:DNA-binding NarL/FixJ family response regulator
VDSSRPIRVAVLDEQRFFAEALAQRLGLEPDLAVVPPVGDLADLRTTAPGEDVDVVLLGIGVLDDVDLHAPPMSSMDRRRQAASAALDDISRLMPGCRVIVIASNDDRWIAAHAITHGACGWVRRHVGVDKLLDAIRGVHRDETRIPAELLGDVLRMLQEHRDGVVPERHTVLGRLTPRERQVLECIVDGLSRHEIADRLFLSPNTVRTHVQHVLRKLDVHSVLTAAAVARELGVEPPPRARVAGATPWSTPADAAMALAGPAQPTDGGNHAV